MRTTSYTKSNRWTLSDSESSGRDCEEKEKHIFFHRQMRNTRLKLKEMFRQRRSENVYVIHLFKKKKNGNCWALHSVQICGFDLLITMCSCKIEICHNCLVIYWIKWTRIAPLTKPTRQIGGHIVRTNHKQRKNWREIILINEESSHVLNVCAYCLQQGKKHQIAHWLIAIELWCATATDFEINFH